MALVGTSPTITFQVACNSNYTINATTPPSILLQNVGLTTGYSLPKYYTQLGVYYTTEFGVDYSGNDILNYTDNTGTHTIDLDDGITGKSAQACQDLCTAEPTGISTAACMVALHDPSADTCWLKTVAATRTVHADRIAYTKRHFDYYYTSANDIDHSGNDIRDYTVAGMTQEACQRYCDQDLDCMVAMFKADESKCWIKSSTQN
jgi:hypothetical protein